MRWRQDDGEGINGDKGEGWESGSLSANPLSQCCEINDMDIFISKTLTFILSFFSRERTNELTNSCSRAFFEE